MQQHIEAGAEPGRFRRFLDDQGLVAVFDYWCALRRDAGGRTPARRAFDPMRVRRQLPQIEVYRRAPGARLRCCLSGTGIRRETGREHTGLHLDELLPQAARASRAALFERTLATAMPVAYRCDLPVPGREHKVTTRLLLPMLDERKQATIVVSMVYYRLAALSITATFADPHRAPEALTADAKLDCRGAPYCAAA